MDGGAAILKVTVIRNITEIKERILRLFLSRAKPAEKRKIKVTVIAQQKSGIYTS